MSEDKGDSSYRVGYQHPPREHQFQRGRSGNPKGRPKTVRTFHSVIQASLKRILERQVSVTENGKTRRMAAVEVMIRRLEVKALRGDSTAFKNLLALEHRYSDDARPKLRNTSIDKGLYDELMLLGSSKEDQRKASFLYQQLIRSTRPNKK